MEHEQKSGGLLRLLRLLWLLPHSWAVLEGKTLPPLCVRAEGGGAQGSQ